MELDWTQALTIIFTVFGMLLAFVIYLMSRIDSNQKETSAKFEQLLNRMDQKSDHLEQKMDSNQKELEQKMDSNQKENNAKFEAMNSRFNGLENRLTAMEIEIKIPIKG